jgi:hypothetical protein
MIPTIRPALVPLHGVNVPGAQFEIIRDLAALYHGQCPVDLADRTAWYLAVNYAVETLNKFRNLPDLA